MRNRIFGRLTLIFLLLAITAGSFAFYLSEQSLSLKKDIKNGETISMKKGEYQFFIKDFENQTVNDSIATTLNFHNKGTTVKFESFNNLTDDIHPMKSSFIICEDNDWYKSIGTLNFEVEADYLVRCSDKFSYAYRNSSDDIRNFEKVIIFIYTTIALLVITIILFIFFIIFKSKKT